MELIADEELKRFSRDNVFAHVSAIAEGMGYYATPIFPDNLNGSSKIVFFSKNPFANTLAPKMLQLLYIPDDLTKTAIIRIYSNDTWQTTGYDPGFAPREVGVAIMRGLLRLAGERGQAEDWQPLEVTSKADPTPYIRERATAEDVAKLNSLRDALEATQAAEALPEELQRIRDVLARFAEFETVSQRETMVYLAGLQQLTAYVDLSGSRHDAAGRLVVFLAGQGAGAGTPLGLLLLYLLGVATLPPAQKAQVQALIEKYGP